MPKVNVYVPDEMYAELRRRDLPISQIAQRAFSTELAKASNSEWIARARKRPLRRTAITTEDLMSAARDDFGS